MAQSNTQEHWLYGQPLWHNVERHDKNNLKITAIYKDSPAHPANQGQDQWKWIMSALACLGSW
ncbi:hypothetical protein SK128_001971 [Halocaridina rubra]|uniref:Uncharacterized protein n=1 Tax=Halocaridina rubra TaxID=373956 RepID=A0AAN9AE28_HALRR